VMPGKTVLITQDKMLIVIESTEMIVIRMWIEMTGNGTTELTETVIVTTIDDERTEMIDDETSEMMIDDESREITETTETTEMTTGMMIGEERTERGEETEMMMPGEKSGTDVMLTEMKA